MLFAVWTEAFIHLPISAEKKWLKDNIDNKEKHIVSCTCICHMIFKKKKHGHTVR